jgi:hypothetical protein
MIKEKINELDKKYNSAVVIKGDELLLKPCDALKYLQEIEKMKIGVLGVNVWYTINGLYAEDLSGLDLSSIMNQQDWIHNSIQYAKKFISEQLLPKIEFVSFVFNVD